jgi:translation initiation factor 2B subunit (eIF-2B alpha/beta/delta family)
MTDADLDETRVVTVFLRHDADVLLLRRSDAVGSYAGKWGAVAGHAEGDPAGAARTEIREETGFDPATDTTLVRRGDPFDVVDADRGTRWVVHPFLFDCERRAVEPNYETSAFEWVAPTEILRRETVPDLWKSYDRVRPCPESVRDDREHGSAWLSVRALEVLRDEAALAVERGGSWTALEETARELVGARPAMSVVVTRVDRAMAAASEGGGDASDERSAAGTPAALEATATEGIERALTVDAAAAETAAAVLPSRVATLSRSGTVAAALERAELETVLVAESRPGREGAGTAERLAAATDARVTLTTDAALADRLAAEGVAALVVGADAVLPDGCVVNKVGTRGAALAAAREGIDCYAVAASDKIAATGGRGDGTGDTDSSDTHSGHAGFDPEERDPAEVYDGDADIAVANPTFDATPADCVTAVVTERGRLDAEGVRAVAADHRDLAAWRR